MATRSSLFAAVLVSAAAASLPAHAQSAPPTAASTDEGEVQDSGVGEVDTSTWIDRKVLSADGREIGHLVRVDAVTNNTDGGTLVVERSDGEQAKVPLQGASFDGTNVVVSATAESIDSPAAASAN